jgi:rubrerythrin
MRFILSIFEGTDSIKFGMTSEEIQSLVGIKPTLFKKSHLDSYDTEDYQGMFHVYYEMKDNQIVCCAIEFFKPSKVFLDGVQLLGKPKVEAEGLFKEKFEDYSSDNTVSEEYCIGLYSPRPRVEAIFIARKGYYKEQKEYYKNIPIEQYFSNEPKRYYCIGCQYFTTSETPLVNCPNCNLPMLPMVPNEQI